jgi:hypothetical protein
VVVVVVVKSWVSVDPKAVGDVVVSSHGVVNTWVIVDPKAVGDVVAVVVVSSQVVVVVGVTTGVV